MFNIPDNPYAYVDRSVYEVYKPVISPISYMGSNHGGVIFPLLSSTNKSFNLNIDHYVARQNDIESLFHSNSNHNVYDHPMYHNGPSCNHPFNNIPGFSNSGLNAHFHNFISPSSSNRFEIHNQNPKEVNIQNKILINEVNEENPLNAYVNKNYNDFDRKLSFGPEVNTNQVSTDNENQPKKEQGKGGLNALKAKKMTLPKLDIDVIKSTETYKIFNENLNFNSNYVDPFETEMQNLYPSSSNSRNSNFLSPLAFGDTLLDPSDFKEKERADKSTTRSQFTSKDALRFNISPKSAFLATKKN